VREKAGGQAAYVLTRMNSFQLARKAKIDIVAVTGAATGGMISRKMSR